MSKINNLFSETDKKLKLKKKQEKDYLEKFLKDEEDQKLRMKILGNPIDIKNENQFFKENCLKEFKEIVEKIKKIYEDIGGNPFRLEDDIKMNKQIKVFPLSNYPLKKTILYLRFYKVHPSFEDNIDVWKKYKDSKKDYTLDVWEEELGQCDYAGNFPLLSEEKFKIKEKQKAYKKFIKIFDEKILMD